MSTIAPTSAMPVYVPLASPAVYRMTVDEYEAMAEARILRDPRVELIDGLLVKKMTQKPPHVWTVEVIDDWIVNLVDRQVEVYSNPGASGYQSSEVFKPGQEVPVVLDGSEAGRIRVADILP